MKSMLCEGEALAINVRAHFQYSPVPGAPKSTRKSSEHCTLERFRFCAQRLALAFEAEDFATLLNHVCIEHIQS